MTRRLGWAIAIFWTLVAGISFAWNVLQERNSVQLSATVSARAQFNKDVIYRRWNAASGGVYIPISESSPPNPFLTQVDEREIESTSGRELTLVNPAYMTRQVHQLGFETEGVRAHITSLNPIRPANAPDDWEKVALGSFNESGQEFYSVEILDGETFLRYMAPLITEKGCLKCHAQQGYTEGEIRGGISVAVPLAPYAAISREKITAISLGHLALWLFGLVGIGTGVRKIERHVSEQSRADKAMRASEKRLRGIIENAPIGIALVGRDGSPQLTNPVLEKLSGYSAEELSQIVFTDITHPDDVEKDLPLYRELWSGKRDSYALEKRYIHKEGNIIQVDMNVAALKDDDGNITAAIGMSQDITKRKKAEKALLNANERFSKVMNSLNALVFVSDLETYEILFINRFGIDKWGDCIGKRCWQVLQQDQTGPCSFCMKDRLLDSDGNSAGVVEWEHENTVTGQWFHIQELAIEWLDNRLVRLQIATDITKKIAAEKEREKLISELQKTLSEVKTLRGFLPICSCCKKVRDDEGYWKQIETYVRDHSEAEFSHSLCPDCFEKEMKKLDEME